MTINVREMVPMDFNAVARIAHEEIYDEQPEELVKKLLEDLQADPRSSIFVVFLDDLVAGFLVLQRFDSYGEVESVRAFLMALGEGYQGKLGPFFFRDVVMRSLSLLEKRIKRKIFRLTFELDGYNEQFQRVLCRAIGRMGLRYEVSLLEGAWPANKEDPRGSQYMFNVWPP
ncbi:MAG: hypothetical protein Q8Q38_00555 [bacterium]|nr:hypothetical protein [bacterium]